VALAACPLDLDDLKAIRSEASAVRYASPQLRSNQQVISEDQNWATSINGVSPEYLLMRTWPVAMGSPISQSDIEAGSKVVLLGQTVVDKLFGSNADPTGQSVRIQKYPFRSSACWRARAVGHGARLRRRRVHSHTRLSKPRFQGGLQKFIAGALMVSAVSSEAPPARRIKLPLAARSPPHSHWRRRRFQHSQPDRDGQCPAGRCQDADHASGQHRRGVRSSWAASAS